MRHSSKCFKSVGLTEKFKENSCKLILYVINETFHSYVNIKCLGIFFPFFFFSSSWAPLPWPPLCVCLFYRMVGGLAWGHILLRGRINSWVLWLIHRANSCSPSNLPLLSCPSHPRRWAARRQCLPLPQLFKFSVRFFNKNALSLAEPRHADLEVRVRAPRQPRCAEPSIRRGDTGDGQRQPRLRVSEQDFPGLLASHRAAALPAHSPAAC